MHTFIDEAGSFSGIGEFPSISIVGALIVPSSRMSSLDKEYRAIRASLPHKNGEVKGRLLNESQVSTIVQLVLRHEALFEAAAIDLGTHTKEGLLDYQVRQGNRLTENLTDEHKDTLKKQVWEFRRRFEAFSLPLMVQTVITFELFPRLLELSMMYFSTRRPKELSEFFWIVDAKGNMGSQTEWEDWWSRFILPFLQTRGFQKPLRHLPIGDYSHMKRFEIEATPFIKKMANVEAGDPPAFDLGLIVKENFLFSEESIPGLELVDIITNATRRALVGNLQFDGWKRIPSLMIHRKGQHYITMHSLQADPISKRKYPYSTVLKAFGKGGRSMLPTRLQSAKW